VINNAPLAAYLTDHPQGAIKVIIKAHNCYPYSGQIATNVGIRGFYQNNHAAFRANPVMTRNQFGVAFTLASDRFVRLDLYDARGRVVQHNAGTRFAGSHTILFDQARIGSGLYCWEVIAGQQKAGGRFAVVK
jgi:hypothetical protein